MASYSSSQSGAWNSSSTWGNAGVPADGDTVTINRGHIVGLTTDERKTNGFDNILVYGNLLIKNGGKMRLNGRMYVYGGSSGYFSEGDSSSGGKLEMASDSLIEIRGDNTAQHGIEIRAEQYAWSELVGSDKNLNTTNTVAVTYNDAYITVASASGWAQGDWLTIFKRDIDHRIDKDEGFWVHDVDTTNKRIYLRQFVGPTTTIESVSGSNITVANGKVFRVGYHLIFGTGSNRNVHTVTAINKNRITLSGTVTGSVVGATVYQTGVEKLHVTGETVQRKATTLTTGVSANSTNEITVGDASDLSTGDYILIDVDNDTDFGWDYDSKYQITSIEGNTLTLDANVRHRHFTGSLVHIITRDCRIHAVDDSSNTRVFIYQVYWSSGTGYYRRMRWQNVWFKGLGYNTNSAYYGGVGHHGYNSYYTEGSSDNRYNYESRLDSCVYDTANYRSSYTGFSGRLNNLFVTRNNTSYNNEKGYWWYSTCYNHRFYNNYATRTYYSSLHTDTVYEPYSRIQYFYGTRSDDYGIMIHHRREQTSIRSVILKNHENRPFYTYYGNEGYYFDRFYIDGFRYWPFAGTGGEFYFLDSYIKNSWDVTSPTGTGLVFSNYIATNQESYADYNRSMGKTNFYQFVNYNFEKDSMAQLSGWVLREWDDDMQAWKCYNGDRSNSAFTEQVFVPADTEVRLQCDVKTSSTGSFSMPILFGRSGHDPYLQGQWENNADGGSANTSTANSTHGSPYVGFYEGVAYTSASQSGFETKQLTIQAQPNPYFLVAGIRLPSSNIREEPFYMRDLVIYLEKPAPPQFNLPSSQLKKYGVRSTFTPAKKRIGGTRL